MRATLIMLLGLTAACGPDFHLDRRGFVCDPHAPPACGDGWSCGADGFCHPGAPDAGADARPPDAAADAEAPDASMLVIAQVTPPAGTLGVPYLLTLTASGGSTPYVWSVAAGALPSGLRLAESTGVISGTPTAVGSFTSTIEVEDSETPRVRRQVMLQISIGALPPLEIVTASLPGGVVGDAYAADLTASGGAPPRVWSVSAGALPSGLTLDPTSGHLAGTPTSAGTASFTLTVADSSTPRLTSSRALTLTTSEPLRITTTALPGASIGVAYSASLAATGGTAPTAWSVGAGSLPPGLGLDPGTGAITGTPTSAGSFGFTIRLVNSSAPQQVTAQPLSLDVLGTPSILTASLPGAVLGTAYAANLDGVGGTPPYTWSISAGALPVGLLLDGATGTLSGTPSGGASSAGTISFSVRLADASVPQGVAVKVLSIVVATPLSITTVNVPQGHVGNSFSASVNVAGGTPPYAWSLAAGSLAPGLTLSGSSGLISGTPSAIGTYTFTIRVLDRGSPVQQAERTYNLDIL